MKQPVPGDRLAALPAGTGARGDHRFSEPRVFIPFAIVALVWGSSWFVIKDQISTVAPGWTIAYRLIPATIGMFALAAIRGDGWRLRPGAAKIVVLLGATQFMLNFQFVYRAELWLTSGLVAVFFALLMVPNTILGHFVLGQRITRLFLAGSAVAIAGIVLLLLHEYRAASLSAEADAGRAVLIGTALASFGLIVASIANIAQATPAARAQPFVPLLAWSMAFGLLCDIAFAYALAGPPQWDPRWQYGAGVLYLGLAGTVLTFPLYFALVRNIGAGRAAYNGVAVPIVAMTLSTLFEGYRWTLLAGLGAALCATGLVIALRAR